MNNTLIKTLTYTFIRIKNLQYIYQVSVKGDYEEKNLNKIFL